MSNAEAQQKKRTTYPAYKPSGIEWLGDVPEHWEIKPLKRIFTILNGSTPKSGELDFWDGDISWATPDDLGSLTGDTLNATRRMITQEGYESCGTSLAPAGSLVLSTRAPIGHLSIAGIPLCTNQGCRCLIFRAGDEKRFYYYQLLTAKDELESLGQGSTFKELGRDKLAAVYLAYPPLDEQQAIATFLDRETARIDGLIEKKQRQIELLQEKRSALISHAVTKGLDPNATMKDSGIEWLGQIPEHWDMVPLRYALSPCGDAVKTGPFGSQLLSSEMVGGSIKVYNQRNVLDRDFTSGENYITEDKYQNLEAFSVVPGDILVTTRGTIGRCALFPDSAEPGILHPCLMRIQTDLSKVQPEYIALLIQDSGIVRLQLQLLSNATTIDVIYSESLKSVRLPLPPTSEQAEILAWVTREAEKNDRLIAKVQTGISTLQEYRTALISAAVTGKIDVRREVAA